MEFISLDFMEIFSQNGTIALVLKSDNEKSDVDEKLSGQISTYLRKSESETLDDWVRFIAPSGLECDEVWVIEASDDSRKQGGELAGKSLDAVSVWGADEDFIFGFALRNYRFDYYKSEKKPITEVKFASTDVALKSKVKNQFAVIEGVHMARDLVNEPANILTTSEFASRILELQSLGVEVEILDEDALEQIGMRALLGVGQGSSSPSKVAIMQWMKSEGAPIALVGKGVVFDTGGISIKPAAGMEDMIMDMGGAATVVGTMRAIAGRQAKANVVAIVGLVENMPDGEAQRPGDIVETLKGTTVEVKNTDAEGRLVLADILWYVQERFKPQAMIDLATLTGAVIIALGTHKSGVYGNDDAFINQFLDAAKKMGEGAWHMPLDPLYAKQLKSAHADLGNIGGREAGSITAAEFLHHFVKDEVKWIHIDIAGTATRADDGELSPKGATGWGVLSIAQLIADHFES